MLTSQRSAKAPRLPAQAPGAVTPGADAAAVGGELVASLCPRRHTDRRIGSLNDELLPSGRHPKGRPTVRKPLGIKTFHVLPRRWVVERTFAWIVKCRRLDHDYERPPQTSEAMIKWAMIGLMVRGLEPAPGRKPWQKAPTAA
jgi:hypothetical protein